MSASQIALHDWPRLFTWVEQAMALPVDQREAWLDGLRLPLTLAASLRGLIADGPTTGFLGELPAIKPAEGAPAPTTAGYAAGSLVGPWRLLRLLGRGGMSMVWLAERADRQVERRVALKLPYAGPGQERLAQRLQRERRILASLNHPHIARLYDVGLADDGTPYLVIEHVEGESLTAHADRQRLTLRQRLALFRQVLAAVQYAHAQLVLHRDLKPDNVLVTAAGEVKLLDFGIAKLMAGDDSAQAESQVLTQVAERLLTPAYASPEQLRGEPLTTGSDVYALGVIFCELLCGSGPHPAAGRSLLQLQQAVQDNDAAPPSQLPAGADAAAARSTTPQGLQRQLRGDLDAIALKALDRTAGSRYASVEAFDADIAHWQAGLPISARHPTAFDRLVKFVRRHRLSVSVGATAAAALLAALVVAYLQASAAQAEGVRAAAARDFMLTLFAEASPDRRGGRQVTATQLLEEGRAKTAVQLQAQPRLRAELLAGIGRSLWKAQDTAGAYKALAESAALFQQLGQPLQEAYARLLAREVASEDERERELLAQHQALVPLMAGQMHNPAFDRTMWLRWLHGNQVVRASRFLGTAQDEPDFQPIVDAADMRDPAQATIAFDAQLSQATVDAQAGRPEQARARVALAERIPADGKEMTDDERAARLADHRSRVQAIDSRYAELMQWLPAAIEDCDRAFTAGSSHCVKLHRARLWALLRMGRAQEALALAPLTDAALHGTHNRYSSFQTAYVRVRLLGAAHRNTAHDPAVMRLAQLLAIQGDERLRPDSLLPGLAALAIMHLHAGDRDQAERWLRQGEPAIAALAPGQYKAQRQYFQLAVGLGLQAREHHDQALQAMDRFCAETPSGPRIAILASLECVPSLVALGRQPEAIDLVRQVLTTLDRNIGADAPNAQGARQLLQTLQTPGAYRPGPWTGKRLVFG